MFQGGGVILTPHPGTPSFFFVHVQEMPRFYRRYSRRFRPKSSRFKRRGRLFRGRRMGRRRYGRKRQSKFRRGVGRAINLNRQYGRALHIRAKATGYQSGFTTNATATKFWQVGFTGTDFDNTTSFYLEDLVTMLDLPNSDLPGTDQMYKYFNFFKPLGYKISLELTPPDTMTNENIVCFMWAGNTPVGQVTSSNFIYAAPELPGWYEKPVKAYGADKIASPLRMKKYFSIAKLNGTPSYNTDYTSYVHETDAVNPYFVTNSLTDSHKTKLHIGFYDKAGNNLSASTGYFFCKVKMTVYGRYFKPSTGYVVA